MAIFLTGDTHQSADISKLAYIHWHESAKLTRNDYLIILGDFGFPFLPTDRDSRPYVKGSRKSSSAERDYWYWITWLGRRKYTILWIDGNHENFAFWKKQPVTQWHGGRVQKHPDACNVIHLMRGEVYEIEGKTFWCMGGARSVDRFYRREGISWWPEEIPTIKEINYGLDNLRNRKWTVDYILTHTMPDRLIPAFMGNDHFADPTASYLNSVYDQAHFKRWFCGHFHIDKVDEERRLTALYNTIVKLE